MQGQTSSEVRQLAVKAIVDYSMRVLFEDPQEYDADDVRGVLDSLAMSDEYVEVREWWTNINRYQRDKFKEEWLAARADGTVERLVQQRLQVRPTSAGWTEERKEAQSKAMTGRTMSDEQKEKLRRAMLQYYENNTHASLGRPLTDEHREKIRQAHLARRVAPVPIIVEE